MTINDLVYLLAAAQTVVTCLPDDEPRKQLLLLAIEHAEKVLAKQ